MSSGGGEGGGGGGGGGGGRSSGDARASGETREKRRSEIYTYGMGCTANALNWSWRRDQPFRLAVASFKEEYHNQIHIVQLDEDQDKLVQRQSFEHPYPPTKVMWLPHKRTDATDLLASTGDYLRLWSLSPDEDGPRSEILNNAKHDFCAPLTSFDWNQDDVKLILTGSIDTTVNLWDIETKQTVSQIIAHEKEVLDVSFQKGVDTFVTVGGDGSLRMFDRRELGHSTIAYEAQAPLLRVCYNRVDTNMMATISVNGNSVTVLDIRSPGQPVASLENHTLPVNSVCWAPHSTCHLCSAAEDCMALIWDVSAIPDPIDDPILAYNADGHINWLQWSALQTDWVAISYEDKVQILRV